ncbi:Prolyl oligopeptidase family protein [Duganella sp. CF402]|uniref:alpha/beta hydrolase family protein n=1 Tax=unclassified Duganella TaxID=2636909 RepID=UPI0008CC8738|nr:MULTISPECIES: alpha/beta fold hydrolase [unclassified Duganella]RZT04512.1 prolyl oligopeptidase family protein [Duganella sp. BK701]SEM33800.1 Prolyl oligopeptidase family protein [Duganella sp. CF402]
MKTSLSLLFCALLATGAQAAAPAAEQFFQTTQLDHVSLSPKGGYVAAVAALPKGESALLVRDTRDLSKFKVIVKTSDQQVISAVHWVNENRIGFTFKNLRIEFEGNLDEMAADRDGSNLTHLISGNWEHNRESTGSMIKARVLTADYAFFDVAHDGSDDILVEKYSWNNIDSTPDRSYLFRLNTRTRQLSEVLDRSLPDSVQDWLTDARDLPRVGTARRQGRCTSFYRAALGAPWQELDSGECFGGRNFTPLFFDGDDTLYVRASHKGYGALFRYDLKAMKMADAPFISLPGFDFEGAPEIDIPSGRLLGIHLQTDAGVTHWFHPQLKAEQARIDALLPGTTNTIRCAADCLATPVLLVAASSDRQPTHYVIYQRASGTLVSMGSEHPDIDAAQMGLRDFHRYRARDGRSIPAYVTLPPGPASGPRPAVVLVHGGPNVRGTYWDWDAEAQFLATRGYVVIQPEFRGGTGFGADHFNAGLKQWGMAMQDDLADAAQWAVKQGWADPKRIAIMGASYGGYATLMGLIKEPQLFRCGVEWAGVTDIGLRFSSPHSDASREVLNYSLRTLIGDPDKDAELFRKYSPLVRAAELKQPLLMAHGAEDKRVTLEHATRFHDAVQQHNKNVEFITYPNEGHGWRHEDNRIAFWRRVETFLDKNLKQAD